MLGKQRRWANNFPRQVFGTPTQKWLLLLVSDVAPMQASVFLHASLLSIDSWKLDDDLLAIIAGSVESIEILRWTDCTIYLSGINVLLIEVYLVCGLGVAGANLEILDEVSQLIFSPKPLSLLLGIATCLRNNSTQLDGQRDTVCLFILQ